MPELDPKRDGDQDDEEYLADAYAALDDDQHRQHAESAAQTGGVDIDGAAAGTDDHEQSAQSTAATVATDSGVEPPEPAPKDATAHSSVGPNRRVFLIDNKEYPDPDPELPITGTRSVQVMYRDYFPGQLDNVDIAQKTRPDGTVEITFKRRIGTKGVGVRAKRLRSTSASGEVVITLPSVVKVLACLPPDRPLAWDLVEQAIGPNGAVRLDYVPPAAQVNLAEAQHAARVRLIDLAVGELRRLRPNA